MSGAHPIKGEITTHGSPVLGHDRDETGTTRADATRPHRRIAEARKRVSGATSARGAVEPPGLALALVLTSSAVGCGAAEFEYIRPWFRVATSPRHVIAPHALEWGGGRRAELRVGGDWRALEHVDFRVHPLGDAVALDEYTYVDPQRRDPVNDVRASGATGVFIYREDVAAATHIPRCATPRYSGAPAEVACFACGTREPYLRLEEAHRPADVCSTLRVDTYDTRGRPVSHLALLSPIVVPEVEGRLPDGPWIVAEAAPPADFLYWYAPRMRFTLDASGVHPLPFGADPLHRERDAEARAREIERQVPIRDAAVASLRAAFAEDERQHPSWVVRGEVLNRLFPNVAVEPEVPAEQGSCYTFVARASAGLTRLEVSFHRDSPFVPSSIEEVHDGVLAFATGAPVVTLSRCFAPGDPAVYHCRVGSRGGSGYVLARIYAHQPP